jgi:Tetratrico peptide repeat
VDETGWERRVADAWASIDRLPEAEFLDLIERLAAELPAGSAVGLFERASALDSTGHPDLAVPCTGRRWTVGWPASAGAGREREAVSVALAALAPHLPRYQWSLATYARLLVEADPGAR